MIGGAIGWLWLVAGLICWSLAAVMRRRWLVGVGGGALAPALLLAVTPASLWLQAALFIVVAVIASVCLTATLGPPSSNNTTNRMPRRAPRLLGHRASMLSATRAGKGRIQLQDAIWTVRCEAGLSAGQLVEVTGYSGSELQVVPVQENE